MKKETNVKTATYTCAGVSRLGTSKVVKVRFCSDKVLRTKNLLKQGDEDIHLIDLPSQMTKKDCCNYLLKQAEFKPFEADIKLRLEDLS